MKKRSFTLWVLAAILVLRFGTACQQNRRLWKAFSPVCLSESSAYAHYLQHRPMEELQYFSIGWNDTAEKHLLSENQPASLTLSFPLRYYSQPDSRSPIALELPRGTQVYFLTETGGDGLYSLGSGIYSYPTYTKGWRIASPLLTSPYQANIAPDSWQNIQRYYVRLQDLQRVQQEYIRRCLQTALKQSPFSWKTLQNYRESLEWMLFCLHTDEELYRAGYYLSPDLFLPLWDGWDTLLSMAILSIGIFLFLSRRHTRQINVSHQTKPKER